MHRRSRIGDKLGGLSRSIAFRNPPDMTAIDTPALSALGQEWTALQQQYEQHERNALAVRLGALALHLAGWGLGIDAVAAALVVLLLWAQEGMVRAWQARLGERLLRLEAALRGPGGAAPFQLHTEWQAGRRGTLGLVGEYAAHAARPTVAVLYVALLALLATPWG